MWNVALLFFIKLNNFYKEIFNEDIKIYKEDVEKLQEFVFHQFIDKISEIEELTKDNYFELTDLDFNRTLENMNIYDILFFERLLNTSQNGDKVLFKYDGLACYNELLLETKTEFFIYNKLLRSFRGIVLNIKEKELVNTPFDKFANVNEYGWEEENDLDIIVKEFANASLIEESNKLDGSLQSARYYKDEIFLSGSGCIIPEISPSLKEGIGWINEQPNYIQMLKENPNDTHIFEWISLADAHIVAYQKEDRGHYLIGIRNTKTGEQLTYKEVIERAKKYDVKTTELYTKTLDEIIEDCKNLKGIDKEGFVIRLDNHFVKMKCDDYITIAGILQETSSINFLIRYYCREQIDDLLAKVPKEKRPFILYKIDYLNLYCSSMENKVMEYYNQAPKTNRKDFMIWVTDNVPKLFKGYVMNKYLGKSNYYIGTEYRNRRDEVVENYLKLPEIEFRMNILGQPTLTDYLATNCNNMKLASF